MASISEDVKALTGQTIQAFTRGNVAEIAKLASKDFTFVDGRGVQMSASSCFESLADLVSNPNPEGDSLKIKSFKTSEETRRTFGNTVVETLLYTDNVLYRSKKQSEQELHRTFRVTNVWVNEHGSLQLVSMQLTPVHL